MDVGLPIKNPSTLIRTLKIEEGFRSHPYTDTEGYETIGYGRNLTSHGIAEFEAEYLMQNDIEKCIADMRAIFKGFDDMPTDAQHVLVEMRYNLGGAGFRSFRHFIAAVTREDWRSAELELLGSQAAHQLPQRYQRMGRMLRELAE